MRALLLSLLAGIMPATTPLIAPGAQGAMVNGVQANSPTDQAHDIKVGHDQNDRMTVPVRVADSGPYRFLVDTGAERTIISRQLAGRLGLAAGRPTRMQSVAGLSDVSTVDIPAIDISSRRFGVTGAPALEELHIGADGVLGVDSLASSQVLFDFKRGVMAIAPSRARVFDNDPNTIVVEARRRHGRLMFTRASVDGASTVVVIDTGSQITIGNAALRRRLLGRHALGEQTELETVAGEKIMVELATIHLLDLDGVQLKEMRIAFADAPVFRQLDLDQRPAMLLGMNALRGFEKVSIDFSTRRVRFVLPESGATDGLRLASR